MVNDWLAKPDVAGKCSVINVICKSRNDETALSRAAGVTERSVAADRIHIFLEAWFHLRPVARLKCAASRQIVFIPEGDQKWPLLFFPRRFARNSSPCNRPLLCLQTRRTACPPARRSTPPSTTRPTSLPRRRSITAPATSTICSTASVTACRCCRPPTPASPRCRSWSIPQSRSPTRFCRRPLAIRQNQSLCRRLTPAQLTPTCSAAPALLRLTPC